MKKNIRHLSGFTIIELLVVIIIIGILAAITFVSYGGIQAKAKDVSVLSDIENMDVAQTKYGLNHSVSGLAYNSVSGESVELEFKASEGNVIDVFIDVNDYCIRGYNPGGTKNSEDNAFTKESSPGVCTLLLTEYPITNIGNITGVFQVGQELTAGTLVSPGLYPSATYQWQRADDAGGSYFDIDGATSNKYTLTTSDWTKYIKVIATGSGNYYDTVTSSATIQINDPSWFIGLAESGYPTTLVGKYIYVSTIPGVKWKTTNTACSAPQCSTALAPSSYELYVANPNVLVDPKNDPEINIDFSAYPAQDACESIGGRLPTVTELQAIYAGKLAGHYGTHSTYQSWSSTQWVSGGGSAYFVNSTTGQIIISSNWTTGAARCIK